MKAPVSWLKEFVDINVDVETLCKKMVDIGLEVEEVVYLGEKLHNVVVGQITDVARHPDADRLRCCSVDVGGEEPISIVTNAQNVQVGDKVPVALHNSTLATGQKITKGKVRGALSLGMFCGPEELGITGDYYEGGDVDAVLVLRADAKVGEDIRKEIGLDDYVIDVAVTSNRQDCNSVYGLAREIAVALGEKCRPLDVRYTENAEKTADYVTVEVRASDLCPDYFMQGVKNVTIEKSPLWMTSRLAKIGLHGINNMVDITNYVLMEVGQPMHAFDYADISDKKIVVRRAYDGEKIVPLDNKEYTLNSRNLVIADESRAVGLAGIMGGANSGIKSDTACVMFEAARFARENIRKSSRSLGIASDSSARFEKGIDAYTTELALDRALHLVEELHCGEIIGGRIAVREKVPAAAKVVFCRKRIAQLLGIDIPDEKIKEILRALNIDVTIEKGKISCILPPYRDDIARDCDVIEELIRVYGYDNIVGTLMEKSRITIGGKTPEDTAKDKVSDVLCGLHYHEAIFYPFGGKALFDKFSPDGNAETEKYIRLLNPIGEELSLMNQSLLPALLQCAALNQNRKNGDFKLFEFGKVYLPETLPLDALPTEEKRISMLDCRGDFDSFKADVLTVLKTFTEEFRLTRSEKEHLHPGISADILCGREKIGSFGKLHPSVAKNFSLEGDVFVAEISFDKLLSLPQAPVKFRPFAKFPSIDRDFALVVEENVAVQDILDTVKEVCPLCESAKLFDVYRSETLGVDKKSVAISLSFRHKERTLTDGDIEKQISRCLTELKNRFGAVLR